MVRSTSRILTTHIGSLPRPESRDQALGQRAVDEAAYAAALSEASAGVVRQQVDVGLDVINDGEFGKSIWTGYITERLGGFEPKPHTTEHPTLNAGRARVTYTPTDHSTPTPNLNTVSMSQAWMAGRLGFCFFTATATNMFDAGVTPNHPFMPTQNPPWVSARNAETTSASKSSSGIASRAVASARGSIAVAEVWLASIQVPGARSWRTPAL